MRNFLKKIHGLLQSSTSSFHRHDNQYREADKIKKEREIGLINIKNGEIDNEEFRVLKLLKDFPTIETTIDIGAGTGWASAAMSKRTKRVIAIEPSATAIEIGRKLYPENTYPNIKWIIGFAETLLPTLNISNPALFLSGCVLSHLRDTEVERICAIITKIAPPGSALSFAERWGDSSSHGYMWHVRSKDWWQRNLPGWQLDFHGPKVKGSNYNTGIHGRKHE